MVQSWKDCVGKTTAGSNPAFSVLTKERGQLKNCHTGPHKGPFLCYSIEVNEEQSRFLLSLCGCVLMTEKDLLFRLERICQLYRKYTKDYYGDHSITSEEVGECIVYISGLISKPRFDRNDKAQWDEVRRILYGRLEKKSPQTMFELTLGLPEPCGLVVLDETVYGRMYIDEHYQIGLRK